MLSYMYVVLQIIKKTRLLIRLYIARFIYKTIEIIERIFCTEIKITIIHAHTSNQLSEGYCHIIGGNVCNCNFSFLVTIRGIPIINRGRRCGWRGFFFFCFFLHGRKINRLRFLRRGWWSSSRCRLIFFFINIDQRLVENIPFRFPRIMTFIVMFPFNKIFNSTLERECDWQIRLSFDLTFRLRRLSNRSTV